MRTLVAIGCMLEPLVTAHAREMFTVLSDPAIYQFENAPPPSEKWLAQRYAKLENRASADGTQTWLNWVVRLPGGELAGYVQATVLKSGAALVAYELASRYWRKGIGRSALSAVIDELSQNYATTLFAAVLKSANFRSEGLLVCLGFELASEKQATQFCAEPDEKVMVRLAGRTDQATQVFP
jgi:RimJ/RimL family protein N-acetyltransferase